MKRENYPRCFRTTLLIAIGDNYIPTTKERESCANTLSNRYIRRESRRRIPLFNIFSRKEIDFGHELRLKAVARSARFLFFLFLKRYRTQYLSRAQESLSRDAWRWKIIRRRGCRQRSRAGEGKTGVEEKRKSTWNLSSSSWVFFPSLHSYLPSFSLCIARATFLTASFLVFLILPSRAL